MPDLKMLNSTKYLYKLTFIKCNYELLPEDPIQRSASSGYVLSVAAYDITEKRTIVTAADTLKVAIL